MKGQADVQALKTWLARNLKQVSQDFYVASAGIATTMAVGKGNPGLLRSQIVFSLNVVPQRPNSRAVGPGDIKMTDKETSDAAGRLGNTLAETTLLRLDALLHAFLDRLHGRSLEADGTPFEQDLGELGASPKENIRESYKLVILMSVLRNAWVHSDGELSQRGRNRLRDAGWTEIQSARFPPNRPLTLGDCLNFKGAVRSVSNASLQAAAKGVKAKA